MVGWLLGPGWMILLEQVPGKLQKTVPAKRQVSHSREEDVERRRRKQQQKKRKKKQRNYPRGQTRIGGGAQGENRPAQGGKIDEFFSFSFPFFTEPHDTNRFYGRSGFATTTTTTKFPNWLTKLATTHHTLPRRERRRILRNATATTDTATRTGFRIRSRTKEK